ncbi:hypothetical protein CN907_26780 [Bacillus anthracis]|nr:hypothetical protein CN907_26780 [Bacillus anthracis]
MQMSVCNGFLVSTVPKSGTHLLMQILEAVPLMNLKKFYYFETSCNQTNLEQLNNFKKELLSLKKYDALLGHHWYSSHCKELLDSLKVKHVYLYRDPRDVIISYINHCIRFNDQPISGILESCTSIQEAILMVLSGNNNEYPRFIELFNPTYQWIEFKNDSNFYCISYESLVSIDTRYDTIYKLIEFLYDDLPLSINEMTNLGMKGINPDTCPTFHKGEIGQWANFFDEVVKEHFKDAIGNLLIETGYEKDNNW